MDLRGRQAYDQVEQMREMEEAIDAYLTEVADGLKESIPEFVRQYTRAIILHFVRHGQDLDDLIRSSPKQRPMSAQESVEAQLRAMGFKVNPNDSR